MDCNLHLTSLSLSLSPSPSLPQPSEPRTLSYDDHLRDLIDEERKYVRHLNLIMKVFMEPFQNKNLFSQDVSLANNAISVHKIILGGIRPRQFTWDIKVS